MPELPGQFLFLFGNLYGGLTLHVGCAIEVERAAALLRSIGINKQIKRVDTAEDNIVYAGTTAEAFVCFSIHSSDITALTTSAGQ
jgi:hypothetical protein